MGRVIVVVFGLMGTGKTTLARALGEARGWPVIHSDAVRKCLAGLDPNTPMPLAYGKGIYSPEFSIRTYEEMRRLVREQVAAGRGAVLDGSYSKAAERHKVRQLGEELGVPVVFLWCRCPQEVTLERMAKRSRDPGSISDGRAELAGRQAEAFDPPDEDDRRIMAVDTDRPIEAILQDIQGKINNLEL